MPGSLIGLVVARSASSLSGAVLLLVLLALLLASAAGAVARWAGRPKVRRLRAAAGVCLGTLAMVLVGTALLPMADNAEEQLGLLAPMVTGLLFLLPAAALAELVARRGMPADSAA